MSDKTSEEIRKELEELEGNDATEATGKEWERRILRLENELNANSEAIVGLGQIEGTHDKSNTISFFFICGWMLVATLIVTKQSKQLDIHTDALRNVTGRIIALEDATNAISS